MYGPDSPYRIIPFSIIIGLAVPLPFYFAHKFWPKCVRPFSPIALPVSLTFALSPQDEL